MILANCIDEKNDNEIFDGCCCEITCQLLAAGTNRLVQSLELIVPAGQTSSIVSIEGVPYTTPTGSPLPQLVNNNNPLNFVISICSSQIGNIDTLRISASYPGGTDFWDFNVKTLNPALYWTPALPSGYSFGNLPIGASSTVSFDFTNPTICDVSFDWTEIPTAGAGCADLTLNQTNPSTVPAGSTVSFAWTWTPTISGVFGCTQTPSVCGKSFGAIRLDGIAVAASACLNCFNITLKTENGYLQEAPGLCGDYGSGQYYASSAIGERKIVRFDLYYLPGLSNGLELWLNPEFFSDICDFASKYSSGVVDSAPPVAFYIQYFSGIGSATMTLIGAGAATNSQRNFEATFIESANPGEFSIELSYFMTEDLDNWLTSSINNNNNRLLSSSIYEPTQLTSTVPSIYNQIRKGCFLIYLNDPATLVTDPATGGLIPFTCPETFSITQTSRFFNQGLFGGASEYINPVLLVTRNGSAVTEFSTLAPTDIEFQIDSINVGGVSDVVFHLIDASQTNNLVDFLTNYDSSRAGIITDPSIGTLDNHLKTPSIAPTVIPASSIYSTKATIGNDVVVGQEFYLIAIVYSKGDLPNLNIVNSFIFGKYQVTDTPGIEDSCCPLDFTSKFSDYNLTYTTTRFTPTVKERIKHNLRICRGEFAEKCLVDLGLPAEKVNNWLDFANRITLTVLREVVDYPIAGQTTSFVFEQWTATRNTAAPGNWILKSDDQPFTVSDQGVNAEDNCINTEYNGRVRYEEDVLPSSVLVANNATPFTRTSAGGMSSLYISANNINADFANHEIIFEYQIQFDVSLLLGTPFNFVQVFRPRILPFDFEPQQKPRGLDEILFFAPDVIDPRLPGAQIFGDFCSDEYPFIFVRTRKIRTEENLNLIATIDFFPVGIGNLEEEESYISPAAIPMNQLSSAFLYDVDIEFDNATNYAFFKIDLTLLGAGNYQICSIALPKGK